eukprot:Em0005g912a
MIAVGLVVFLAVLVCAASAATPPAVPMVFAEGDSYTIGSTIGAAFKTQILTALRNDTFYNTIMLPYYRTPKGAALYESMFANANSSFPQYVDELQGMADAIEITLEELVLWNFRFDWELLFWNDTLPTPACSDVYLNLQGSTSLMAHNEDNDPYFMDLGYFVHARVTGASGAVVEEFTHYCYPGILCGDAYGFNSNGVVMTQNALFPSDVNLETWAIPRNFLSRAIAGQTLDGILAILNHFPCTSGFSLNVGRLSDMTVLNVEVSPDGIWTTPINGYDYHFNMYLHHNFSEYADIGSIHHLERIKQLPVPTCSKDILGILGDTADPQYPIFRNGAPPDNTVTLGTVLYDLNQKMMYVFRGNPSQNDPMMAFSLTI